MSDLYLRAFQRIMADETLYKDADGPFFEYRNTSAEQSLALAVLDTLTRKLVERHETHVREQVRHHVQKRRAAIESAAGTVLVLVLVVWYGVVGISVERWMSILYWYFLVLYVGTFGSTLVL